MIKTIEKLIIKKEKQRCYFLINIGLLFIVPVIEMKKPHWKLSEVDTA